MPKNPKIKEVLMLGSGSIVIDQAAEFDYAGTQACRAPKEEGVEVVLVNSNLAAIITDKDITDHVYIEPLNLANAEQVIAKEWSDSILSTLSGQTGLNLAMNLHEQGTLEKYGIRPLGTSSESIRKTEDRQDFKDAIETIGQPCVTNDVAENVEAAVEFAGRIGYPVIVRPAYTLGGSGGGIAYDEPSLREIADRGIHLSRIGQVFVEWRIFGWKEIEFEAMRDSAGNVVQICSMENIGPMGVHISGSIVVVPTQTLANREYQMLRSASLNITSALGVEGGCNVQLVFNPDSFEYAVIEANPHIFRSSALASKAIGYPTAKVVAKVALGYTLNEIPNTVTGKTIVCFEPALDYCVLKLPRLPFDKFTTASRTLGIQMRATGEVMAIGNSSEGALMRAIRSLELPMKFPRLPGLDELYIEETEDRLVNIDDQQLSVVAEALRRGFSPEEINKIIKYDLWFLDRFQNIVDMEDALDHGCLDGDTLRRAKGMGFSDAWIVALSGREQKEIKALREFFGIRPAFKMVDICATEFETQTPYYHSTYNQENEAAGVSRADNGAEKRKVLVSGSGPICIGQDIEFDYCSVHSVWAFKRLGYEAIIINNNPETVSTDFDVVDKLYFEPLTAEDVQAVMELEKSRGVVVQFGGQTAIKLAQALADIGAPILGTSADGVDAVEDRERSDKILNQCGIPRAVGRMVLTTGRVLAVAHEVGYPVLVRPPYVLGGQGMEIAYNDRSITKFVCIINQVEQEHPILVDKYLMGCEVEVDGVFDGEELFIPGIVKHIEWVGVRSGDSISVHPPIHIKDKHKQTILKHTYDLSRILGVVGLTGIQFVIYDDRVCVVEVNPRSPRTIPHISKVTGVPTIDLATRAVLRWKLCDLGYGTGIYREADYYAVEMPMFSFEKLTDVDTGLGPEMEPTGECLGLVEPFPQALLKAFKGAGTKAPKKGGRIIITVKDEDKDEMIGIARGFYDMGIKLPAISGACEVPDEVGIPARWMACAPEAHPDIPDMIASGTVDLVVNTPTRGRRHDTDGPKTRRSTVKHSMACITATDTAWAMLTVHT